MNRLQHHVEVAICSALVEGMSIRAISRITGVHRSTIIRFALRLGAACEKLMDERMRNLGCTNVAVDEIWCYVGKKQRHVKASDPQEVGDQWTFVSIDNDSKLVPNYAIGKRNSFVAVNFLKDLAGRLQNRIQLASDKFGAYTHAVNVAFGGNVDYGTVVKSYEAEPVGPGRYSPPKVVSVDKSGVFGDPDLSTLTTSFIERQNLTMRMSMRRFTRLSNGFSKKLEGLRAAVAIHFAHYNLVRRHKTVRTTPAVAAGVEKREWTVGDLVDRARYPVWFPSPQ